MLARLMKLNVALASLAFAACVTINVYFPAAAAEQAAEQVINTVTSGSRGSASAPAPAPAPATPAPSGSAPPATGTPPPKAQLGAGSLGSGRHAPSGLLAAAGHALEWLIPSAQAQAQANIDISSPSVRAITASMQARFDQLKPYLLSGAVGVTANGLVEIRDAAAIPIAERATAKRLVAEDNSDRGTLYAEIAKANGHPEWETDIRGVFAQRWTARAKQEGWYHQDSGGAWTK